MVFLLCIFNSIGHKYTAYYGGVLPPKISFRDYWQPRHIVRSAGSSGAAIEPVELVCAFATAVAIIASIAASFSSRDILSLMIVFALTLMFVDPLFLFLVRTIFQLCSAYV